MDVYLQHVPFKIPFTSRPPVNFTFTGWFKYLPKSLYDVNRWLRMYNHVQMAATVPIVWRLQNVNKCLSSATAPGLHERAFPNPGLTCHYLSWPLLCDWPEHGGAKDGSPQRTFGQGKRYSYTTQQRPLSTMPRLRCLTKSWQAWTIRCSENLRIAWHILTHSEPWQSRLAVVAAPKLANKPRTTRPSGPPCSSMQLHAALCSSKNIKIRPCNQELFDPSGEIRIALSYSFIFFHDFQVSSSLLLTAEDWRCSHSFGASRFRPLEKSITKLCIASFPRENGRLTNVCCRMFSSRPEFWLWVTLSLLQ